MIPDRVSVDLVDLTTENSDLEDLTYPRYRSWLSPAAKADAPTVRAERLAVVARDSTGPLAMALVSWRDAEAWLMSVFVAKAARRHGIATALLDRVEAELAALGITKIHAEYSSRQDRRAFVRLMASRGWSNPEILEFRLAGYADWPDRMGPEWSRFMARLKDAGFGWSAIAKLTEQETATLQALEDEQGDDLISYWKFAEYSDPAISILLRQHGELVGYILGETDEKTGQHHYTSGYVTPRLQRLGWLPAGLEVVCRLQGAAYGAKSVALYETRGTNTRMVGFMKRRLTPVTIWMDERYRVTRLFQS